MIIQVIQLSASEVTCARFARNGKEADPVSGFRFSWNSHEELATILKENCPSGPEDIRTLLAVPLSMVTLREITLPITDRRKIRAILPIELSGETAAETSSIVADAFPLANGKLLAGWLPSETLRPLIDLLKGVGMEPEIVTVACFHWHLLLPESAGTVALHDNTALMIAQDCKPAYCRHLDAFGANLEQTLAVVELTHELQASGTFSFESLDQPSGNLKTELLPLPAALSGETMGADMPALALASPYAIALAFCSDSIQFNLRTGPLAWSGRQSRLLRTFRVPIILAVLLIVLLFSELGVRFYLLSTDLTSLDSSISKIYKEIFPTRKKAVDESAEIKAEIRRLESSGSSLQALAFMKFLADSKGDGINGLSEIELDGERFMLKGDASTSAEVTAFKQRISGNDWNVEQPEITSRPNGTVMFTMRGSRKGGKP